MLDAKDLLNKEARIWHPYFPLLDSTPMENIKKRAFEISPPLFIY